MSETERPSSTNPWRVLTTIYYGTPTSTAARILAAVDGIVEDSYIGGSWEAGVDVLVPTWPPKERPAEPERRVGIITPTLDMPTLRERINELRIAAEPRELPCMAEEDCISTLETPMGMQVHLARTHNMTGKGAEQRARRRELIHASLLAAGRAEEAREYEPETIPAASEGPSERAIPTAQPPEQGAEPAEPEEQPTTPAAAGPPPTTVTERRCPDDGACHHECGNGDCWRVQYAEPLSGTYEDYETWPPKVLAENGVPHRWAYRRINGLKHEHRRLGDDGTTPPVIHEHDDGDHNHGWYDDEPADHAPTPVPDWQYEPVRGTRHVHRGTGQAVTHDHDGGDHPHGYYHHPEDHVPPEPPAEDQQQRDEVVDATEGMARHERRQWAMENGLDPLTVERWVRDAQRAPA